LKEYKEPAADSSSIMGRNQNNSQRKLFNISKTSIPEVAIIWTNELRIGAIKFFFATSLGLTSIICINVWPADCFTPSSKSTLLIAVTKKGMMT
jgi:hypothetical protein